MKRFAPLYGLLASTVPQAVYGAPFPPFGTHAAYGLEMYGAGAGGIPGAPGIAAPGRQVVVDNSPGDKVRRFPIGFVSAAAVAAGGGTANVTNTPQVAFRPEKIIVPSAISASFDISNVIVGKDSQFVAPGNLPAAMFSELAADSILNFHAVQISQVITIAVTNNGGAALIFQAAMVGTAVE